MAQSVLQGRLALLVMLEAPEPPEQPEPPGLERLAQRELPEFLEILVRQAQLVLASRVVRVLQALVEMWAQLERLELAQQVQLE